MIAPAGADPVVDCHVHVFDPARFAYGALAHHPGPHKMATAGQPSGVMDAHGINHALVVKPSTGYGPDNRVTADAIARHSDRLRGIAVLGDNVGPREIEALKAAGFFGARMDLVEHGPGDLAKRLDALIGRPREHAMVLLLQTEGDSLEAAAGLLRRASDTVVIDHVCRPDPARGLSQPGFRRLLDLGDNAAMIVKLSGLFRFPREGHPYADADPCVAAVLGAFGPERNVWGSDWPFVRTGHRLDYGPVVAALQRWVPDEAVRHAILWETPRRVFGFGEGA